MFTENSIVVKAWVEEIQKGNRTLEEVPNLSNLIDVVTGIVEGGE